MRFTFAVFLLSCYSTVFAQTWFAVGSGTDGYIEALAMYKGDLYTAGKFTVAGGVSANNIAKWNGLMWSALGSGVSGEVKALCVYNGKLYVAGNYVYAGGKATYCISSWNGAVWDTVGPGTDGYLWALCVYKNGLYAGGLFTHINNGLTVNNVARWNDTIWSAVGAGIHDPGSGLIDALAVCNDELYAGGYFNNNALWGLTLNHIAKWNGTYWDTVGAGFDNDNVSALAAYNGQLYAVGNFDLYNRIARWNEVKWDSVGSGSSGVFGLPLALGTYNNSLYVGGGFSAVGGVPANGIARWDGSNWSAVGTGMDSAGGALAFTVDTITNSLYVGGGFTTAGGISANNVARWSEPLGIKEAQSNVAFTIYPNPGHNKHQYQNLKYQSRSDQPAEFIWANGLQFQSYSIFNVFY